MGGMSPGAPGPTGPTDAFPDSPPQRLSAGEQVALHIRRLIFTGTLGPGARIRQTELAQELGVSRIPVRDALIALEREGWVTIELHRGAFVCPLDEDRIRDHYRVYGLMLGLGACRALERPGADQLAGKLKPVVTSMPGTKEPAAFSQSVLRFNRIVLEAARSHPVETVMRCMTELVPGDFFTMVPSAIPTARRGTRRIYKAIQGQDADEACHGYEDMMRDVGEHVVKLCEERGLSDRESA